MSPELSEVSELPAHCGEQVLPQPITCIINTRSRRGRDGFRTAVEALRRHGVPLAEARAVKSEQQSIDLLQREVARGAAMVIVGGGDGTLSRCAEQLVHTPVAMGVLPMGTGNTLARSLGIPLDLDAAAQALASGVITKIDVGRVNGRVFLNSVTLGLSCEIAHALDGRAKKRLGLLAWPVVGGKIFLQHRPLVLQVSSPDGRYRVRTHQLVVANGRYIAGPVAASPEATIDDRLLSVFVLGGGRKFSLVTTALRWLRGTHTHSPEARFFETRKVRIQSLRGRIPADINGEVDQYTPLDIEIDVAALRMVVPCGFDSRTV